MANYDYNRISEFVEEITNNLGVKRLYTTKNKKYPNARPNFLLKNPNPHFKWEPYMDAIIATCKQYGVHPEITDKSRVNRLSFSWINWGCPRVGHRHARVN